ncbi:MAG: S8 family serine peptidase [Pirellulales bacterium]
MLYKIRESERLPEYHKNLLIVKVDTSVAAAGAPRGISPMGPRGMFAASDQTPGIAALSFYERNGLIKRVMPLGRRRPPQSGRLAPMGAASIFARSADEVAAAAADSRRSAHLNRGVSIVELEEGANLEQLQASIVADPHVSYASRVPVRYLLGARRRVAKTTAAGKKGAASPAGGATIAATPPAVGQMWNLRAIRWQEALDAGLGTAPQVKVAVLDSGIDTDHPDLPGSEVRYVYEYPESSASTSPRDASGHGTHVAGTIRAGVNRTGINGICECQLWAYKIFDEPATDPVFDPFPHYPYYVDPVLYLAALADCLDAGIQVVNLSIGGGGRPDFQEQQLFDALLDAGVTVVAAMGNENSSLPSYPAAIPGAIAVAATGPDDSRASFSNRGPHVALSAPGVGIWSTLPTYAGQTGYNAILGANNRWRRGEPMRRETDYDAWDGTSMATPHVTAAAAMAIGKYGQLSAAEMRDKLTSAVDKVAGMRGNDFSPRYGYGRLNLPKL